MAETEPTDANAADKIIGGGLKLIDLLTKQLQAAEAWCERLNEQLQGGLQQLCGQVDQMSKDLVAKQAEIDQMRGGGS
jgi:hypothetical protein